MTSQHGGSDVAPPGYCCDCQSCCSCHDDVTNDVSDDDVMSPMYLKKIVAELIETERTYVAELQQIVQVLRTSLSARINLSVKKTSNVLDDLTLC